MHGHFSLRFLGVRELEKLSVTRLNAINATNACTFINTPYEMDGRKKRLQNKIYMFGGGLLCKRRKTNEIIKIIKKTMKRILAMPALSAATPE